MKNYTNPIAYLCRLIFGVLIMSSSWHALADCPFFDGFQDNQNGTVTDPRNGLVWKRCAEGFTWTGNGCEGSERKMNWIDAMRAAKQSRYLGKADWRIPTHEELVAVSVSRPAHYPFRNWPQVDNTKQLCADNESEKRQYAASSDIAHPIDRYGHPGFFWSSTPDATRSGLALYANFLNGSIVNQSSSERMGRYDVRLVRGNQKLGGSAKSEFDTEYAKLGKYGGGVSEQILENERREKAFRERVERNVALRDQKKTLQSSSERGAVRDLVYVNGTHVISCNNGYSDGISATPLGQYCGKSSENIFQCFGTPSLAAQHICR